MAWQKKFLWFQWLVETGKSALKRAVLETRSHLFGNMGGSNLGAGVPGIDRFRYRTSIQEIVTGKRVSFQGFDYVVVM